MVPLKNKRIELERQRPYTQLVRSQRWHLVLLAAYILFAARMERRPLLNPGHALALCGLVVATALIVWRSLSRTERGLWCALAIFLLAAEVHEARAFRKAEQTFLVCFLHPDGSAVLQRVGTANLRDVTVRVIDSVDLHALHAAHSEDLNAFRAAVQTVQMGSFLAENTKSGSFKPLQAHGDRMRYQLFFSADNGSWWEAIEMQKVQGHWSQALRVWRYQGPTPVMLYQSADPELAHVSDGPRWQWAEDMLQ